jgi:large subunit ribosomal protein L15
MINLHTLQPTKTKRVKRLGRGNASRGNYSGRGMKGQKARSGVGGLKQRAIKSWLMKIPKNRGFKSLTPIKEQVNLKQLEKYFDNNAMVTPFILQRVGLINNYKHGVKIIATGSLKKKLNIKVHAVSAGARIAIEKNGGTIELMAKAVKKKKTK